MAIDDRQLENIYSTKMRQATYSQYVMWSQRMRDTLVEIYGKTEVQIAGYH